MAWARIEGTLYWTVFVASFLAVAIWETRRPRRPLAVAERRRWGRHAVVLAIGAMLSSLVLFGTAPVVMAVLASARGIGLFHRIAAPLAVQAIVSVLLLDLVKYTVHRAHHAVPLLWRVHQVHHSDPDFDVSTAGRFHPIELILTQVSYVGAVAALGAPAGAVLSAELLVAFHGVFAHANASLPAPLEQPLRRVLVTPDMHRIHHSEEAREHWSNFGDVFPWWDRLFGTYLESPASGQAGLVPGLKGFQNERSLGLRFMLGLPFQRRSRDVP